MLLTSSFKHGASYAEKQCNPSWHVFNTFRHTLSVLQDLQRQLQAAALEGELWQEEARQALLREREELQLQADRKLGVHQMEVWDPAAACVAAKGAKSFLAVVLVHKARDSQAPQCCRPMTFAAAW